MVQSAQTEGQTKPGHDETRRDERRRLKDGRTASGRDDNDQDDGDDALRDDQLKDKVLFSETPHDTARASSIRILVVLPKPAPIIPAASLESSTLSRAE